MLEFMGKSGRYSIFGLGLIVASCQTSGGNIFGDAAPTAENSENAEQVATADPNG